MFLAYSNIQSCFGLFRARLFVFVLTALFLLQAVGATGLRNREISRKSCVAVLTDLGPSTSRLSREKIKEFFDLLNSKGIDLTLEYALVGGYTAGSQSYQHKEKGYRYFKEQVGFFETEFGLISNTVGPDVYKILNDLFLAYGDLGLIEREGLWPALTFFNGKKYKFIRLGLDIEELKNLSSDFVLFDGDGELNGDDYSRAIRAGYLPLTSDLLPHDLGHIVDGIFYPEAHMGYRRFNRVAADSSRRSIDLEGSKLYALIEINFIINEFLFFPDKDHKKNLFDSFEALRRQELRTLSDFKKYFEKLTEESLLTLAKDVSARRYEIAVPYGGGAKDHNAVLNYSDKASFYTAAKRSIFFDKSSISSAIDDPAEPNRFIEADTFGLIILTEHALRFIDNEGVVKNLRPITTQVNHKHRLIRAIQQALALIFYRTRLALELGITPEQVHNDVVVLAEHGVEAYRQTLTFSYYSRAYEKGTPHHMIFVEGVEP